jgi:cell division protein FtsI (penicillin-binding protein 3)
VTPDFLDRRANIIGWVLVGSISIGLGTMLVRVAQLQLRPGDRLKEHSEPRVSTRADLPLRGDIMDRRGRLLASTRFGYRVILNPIHLAEARDEKRPKKRFDPHETIGMIADAAGLDQAAREKLGDRVIAAMDYNDRIAEPDNERPASLAELLRSAIGDTDAPEEPPIEWVMPPMPEDQPWPADGPPELVPARPPKPIQYLVATGTLPEDQVLDIAAMKRPGISLERTLVREYPGGDAIASVVGLVGAKDEGLLGAERMLNSILSGRKGSLSFVRDANGTPLWIDPGSVNAAIPGADVRLSLDLEVQRICGEELQRGVEEADSQGGRIIAMDPRSGEILAMLDIMRPVADAVDYPYPDAVAPIGPDGKPMRVIDRAAPVRRYKVLTPDEHREKHPAAGRNRCVEDIYEPGSTFKAFVWSTVTELRRAHVGEVFETGSQWTTPYGRTIPDTTVRGTMTWEEVLINSSNIGMSKAGARLERWELHGAVRRFGFGQKTGIDLPGEATGLVTSLHGWSVYTHTSVSYGHEVGVTPVQMVRAFSAFARNGDDAGTIPQIRVSAATPEELRAGVVVRVLQPATAKLTREVMSNIAERVETAQVKKGETESRYRLFGKSGTAQIPLNPPEGKRRPHKVGYFDHQYFSSFVAAGPLEDPRLVVLCVIDDPAPRLARNRLGFGSQVAGPVVRRVMERALPYLGAPESKPAQAPAPTAQAAAPSGASRAAELAGR